MKHSGLIFVLACIATGCTGSAASVSVVSTTSTTVVPTKAITFAFVGDVLSHTPLIDQAKRTAIANSTPELQLDYDFRPMFLDIKPLVSGVDVAVCHLETPIAPDGEELSTYPFFGVPKEITAAIADAGFDRCSTASNHTYDRGNDGIDATVNALQDAGIQQSGMARTPKEIEPRIFTVKGVNLCHLSYTFSYNGLIMPDETQWRSAIINTKRILRDAQRARELGSQATIVSMHWGRETQTDLSDFQLTNSDAITKSGLIDLVVGHHAHVVQKIEQVNGVWTVFGLSNLISYLPTTDAFPNKTQDGMIVTTNITLNPDGSVQVEQPVVYPTWVDKKNGVVVRPILTDLLDPTVPDDIKAELNVSLERSRAVVGDFFAAAS